MRAYLAVRRAEGCSFDHIAREISAKGALVGAVSVQRWAATLGVHAPKVRASA
jgi:hypothetical protein